MPWRSAGAWVLALGAGAAAGQGFEIPADIQYKLRTGRCESAVHDVNHGLSRQRTDAMLLAGWMYERGLCVKTDIDKAYALYEQAHAKGDPLAPPRLAALAGTTVGGADVAAVLWWARRSPAVSLTFGELSCDPLPGQADATAQALVGALSTWPQSRLAACRGVVAMRALLVSELRFPARSLWRDGHGTLTVGFNLADGSHSIQTSSSRVDADMLRYVDTVVKDALARVPRTAEAVEDTVVVEFRIE